MPHGTSGVLHHAGGYFGLLMAPLAFYLSVAEIINEAHGRTVLPVGTIVQEIDVTVTVIEGLCGT